MLPSKNKVIIIIIIIIIINRHTFLGSHQFLAPPQSIFSAAVRCSPSRQRDSPQL